MNMEEQIRRYAQSKGIKPEAYEQFREGILKGLAIMKLRTDRIDERKYIQIANLKSTKEVLQCKKEYHPMDMFE